MILQRVKRQLRLELRVLMKAFCRWAESQDARTYAKDYNWWTFRLWRLRRMQLRRERRLRLVITA